MLLEERSPLLVQQRTVGLQIVLDALVRPLVFLLQFYHFVEELQPQQRGLSALPRKNYFFALLAFDVLLDVRFENFVGDAELAVASQQLFLMQVIAVGAVDVADRSEEHTSELQSLR